MKFFFIKLHRYLGLVLSMIFVIWFISGFVMIFKSFPKPMKAEYTRLNGPIRPPITIDNRDSIKTLILHTRLDQSFLTTTKLDGRSATHSYPGMKKVDVYSEPECRKLAVCRARASVCMMETISDYDRWIPWGKYKEYFPIYKYHMNDEKKTVLYVSSITGEIVQETDCTTRFWAYFGAIPHWVYIKQLRLHVDCWKNTIITISALGSILCFVGLWLGIYSTIKSWKRKKKHRTITPYKHLWFRWHHILGLLFGLITFTYVFSGMMSLCEVPQFIAKSPEESIVPHEVQALPLARFTRNLNEVLKHYPQTNCVEWNMIGGEPYYKIRDIKGHINLVNADSNCLEHHVIFSRKELRHIYSKQIGQHPFLLTLQREYDNYYMSSEKQQNSLPVYRLDMDDAYKTALYIDPKSSELLAEYNLNTRIRRWSYNFLHSFNSRWLMEHTFWRRTLEIFFLSGGLLLSITSLILMIKRSRRVTRPKFK